MIENKALKETSINYYEKYRKLAEENSLSNLFNPEPIIDAKTQEIQIANQVTKPTSIKIEGAEKNIAPLSKRESIPPELRFSKDENLRLAALFFHELIKPILATGKDAYKPTQEDIINFCKQLTTSQLNFVFYYALSKTQSPIRTGSPDNVIDFAELEMLKYWATLISVGKKLGFNPKLIIIDETSEIPFDEFLGFNEEQIKLNHQITRNYLKNIFSFSNNEGIQIKSLTESVRVPLGSDFDRLYVIKLEENEKRLLNQISSNQWTPETIRMKVFLECMTQKTWEQYKIKEFLSELDSPQDFFKLHNDLLTYIIRITSHFKSIMDLREEAAKRSPILPEYQEEKIYGGVTRSLKRWSFLPVPTKWNGQTINPMHGLATYDRSGSFFGVVPYHEAIKREYEIVQIKNYEGKPKPLFVIMKK